MEYDKLPPPPQLRIFTKGELIVANICSLAGISSSFFVSSPEGTLLVDAGDGSLRDMIELARLSTMFQTQGGQDGHTKRTENLIGALITHGHYDHCAGLLSILAFQHLMGRTSPFIIAGPNGADYLWSLVDLFESTLWEKCPFEMIRVKLTGEGTVDIGPFHIKHIETAHRESRPGVVGRKVHSMAYRVENDDGSIFLSGDCSDIGPLKPLSKDASLAIVEATFPSAHPDQEGVHLTVDQARELGSAAKEMWLVHLTAMSAPLTGE